MIQADPNEMIDYIRYLNCEECRKTGLYCTPHRVEVEEILTKCHSGFSDEIQIK